MRENVPNKIVHASKFPNIWLNIHILELVLVISPFKPKTKQKKVWPFPAISPVLFPLPCIIRSLLNTILSTSPSIPHVAHCGCPPQLPRVLLSYSCITVLSTFSFLFIFLYIMRHCRKFCISVAKLLQRQLQTTVNNSIIVSYKKLLIFTWIWLSSLQKT